MTIVKIRKRIINSILIFYLKNEFEIKARLALPIVMMRDRRKEMSMK